MPVHKCAGGWKWGKSGKCYSTREEAERQARAIYASRYAGNSAAKNPLRADPTRTATLRRQFENEMTRRFARFRRKLVSLIVDEDAFGLRQVDQPFVMNSKMSSTQLNVTDPECLRLIRELQSRLDPTDMIELETEPHVTVRYGLTGQDPKAVQDSLKKSGPVWMTLGRLSLFQHPDQDVLYLSVESQGLEKLNQELGKLPHTDTHDDYVPHLTVARLRPGTGWKYLSDPSFLEWQSYAFTSLTFSDKKKQQTEIALNEQTQNTRWAFRSSPEKIKEFLKWLEGNLRPILTDEATTEDDWWNKYVQAGFKKGAARSYDDMKKAGAIPPSKLLFYLDQKDEFLKSAFRQPESVEKVKLLAGRVYTELKGVTEVMSQNLTRTLTDGLTQGMNPRQIATNIVKDVNGIGIKRARVIARTEIIRAHAEGQLDSMERLGVKELAVMVEWNTAGDARVCPLCSALHGIVVTIDEAKGLIPRHPQCVVGGTIISARDVTSLMRTNYTGQIVEVLTRKGRRLSVTANHMLLTQYGFLCASSLYEGLKIFDAASLHQSVKDPDDHAYQTSIADVFTSLLEDGRMLAERVPLTPEDLHGDGGSCDSEVYIVRANGVLWDQVEPITHGGVELCLVPTQFINHEGRLSFLGSNTEFFERVVRPSDGSMGRHRELLSLLLGRLLHSQQHRLTPIPGVDPVTLQTFVDRATADSVAFRECVRAHPVLKQLDDLLFREDSPISIRDYLLSGESQSPDHRISLDTGLSGDLLGGHAGSVESDKFFDEVIGLRFSHVIRLPVYDVQTLETFYLADGLINSNCRCAFVPANVGEDQSEQVRGAARIKKAIQKSLVAGKPKRGKSKSSWAGARRKISSFRPKSRV